MVFPSCRTQSTSRAPQTEAPFMIRPHTVLALSCGFRSKWSGDSTGSGPAFRLMWSRVLLGSGPHFGGNGIRDHFTGNAHSLALFRYGNLEWSLRPAGPKALRARAKPKPHP